MILGYLAVLFFNCIDYVTQNSGMILSDELGGMWNAVTSCLKVISQNLPGKEITQETSIIITGLQAKN